jgi:hypothetical protein
MIGRTTFLSAMRRFLAEEEGGQALILVLLFLLPMVWAFGLVVRTDRQIVARMQLANAADAAALAAGNMYARALNQVAINNLQIMKIASLQTALIGCFFGAGAVFAKLFLLPFKEGPGEFGRTLKAFKCWLKVFQIAWPACSKALAAAAGGIAAAETGIGLVIAIIALAAAVVGCAIAITAALCLACLAVMMAAYILIAQWWAMETIWLTGMNYQMSAPFPGGGEGTALIRKLGDHSEQLIERLPAQMREEMRRVARANQADDAFLATELDFRQAELSPDRITGRTVVRGSLSPLAGAALLGFNGANLFDVLKYWGQVATNQDFRGSFLTKLMGQVGSPPNREIFVSRLLGKQSFNLDWIPGMLYFEGPLPDVYKTTIPWKDLLEEAGLKDKLEAWLNRVFSKFPAWKDVTDLWGFLNSGKDFFEAEGYFPRGPVLWYLNWLVDVHFGRAQYFLDENSLNQGHQPLGNPDTIYPACNNWPHPGCDGNRSVLQLINHLLGAARGTETRVGRLAQFFEKIGGGRLGRIFQWLDDKVFKRLKVFQRWLNRHFQKLGCQFLPCSKDWSIYTADWAKLWADFTVIPALTKVRFADDLGPARLIFGKAKMYYLPREGPIVDFVVAAKKTNEIGFFHRVFPSRGAFGDSNNWAASKFRLYNPTELHGLYELAEPDVIGRALSYAEIMMAQDWRAKLVPIGPGELRSNQVSPRTVLGRVRH